MVYVTDLSVHLLFFVIHFLRFVPQITTQRFKMHTGYERSMFILTAILLFVSCQSDKNTVRKTLSDFEKEQIEIPSDMLMIKQGSPAPYRILDSLPLLILYVSPEECSQCRIDHLIETYEMFQISEDSDEFQFLIILSPEPDVVEDVKDKLMAMNFNYPVYLDLYGDFSRQNRIPTDLRFHCFLTDLERHPVIVGNPISDEKIKTLMFRYLSENSNTNFIYE